MLNLQKLWPESQRSTVTQVCLKNLISSISQDEHWVPTPSLGTGNLLDGPK